jgi:predicted ATPase
MNAAMGETAAVLQPRAIGRLVEGPGSNDSLRQAWAHRHERGGLVRERAIPVGFGRSLRIKSCCGSAAYVSFGELCGERPGETRLGASDYIALAGHLSEIYLAELPILTRSRRNEARRFVMLVDALYEARSITLHLAAPSALQQLMAPLLEATADAAEAIDGAEVAVDGAGPVAPSFQKAPVGGRFQRDGELASFFTAKDESFMLRRTMSRLREMCREVPVQEGAESFALAQLGADDGSRVRSDL